MKPKMECFHPEGTGTPATEHSKNYVAVDFDRNLVASQADLVRASTISASAVTVDYL